MKKELLDRIDVAQAWLKTKPIVYQSSDGYWRTDPDTCAHDSACAALACARAYSIGRAEKALEDMRRYVVTEVDDEH